MEPPSRTRWQVTEERRDGEGNREVVEAEGAGWDSRQPKQVTGLSEAED
jgi:hypothetical protein